MVDIHRDNKEEEDMDTDTEVNPRQEERVSEEAQEMLREEMEQVKSVTLNFAIERHHHTWARGKGGYPLLKPKVRLPPLAGSYVVHPPVREKIFQGFVQNSLKMAQKSSNM